MKVRLFINVYRSQRHPPREYVWHPSRFAAQKAASSDCLYRLRVTYKSHVLAGLKEGRAA
jgi:hypothetical protein